MTTRFVLFHIEPESGHQAVLDIVEAKDKYRPNFFRSMSRQVRSGEATFFIVGAVGQPLDDGRRIGP